MREEGIPIVEGEKIGVYQWRHTFAKIMKPRIPLVQFAEMMRTSSGMIEKHYGKLSQESFSSLMADKSKEVWGEVDKPVPMD